MLRDHGGTGSEAPACASRSSPSRSSARRTPTAIAAPAAAAPAAPAPLEAAPATAAPQPTAKEAAKESEEEPFGKAGVINIASDIEFNIQHTGYSAPSGGVAPSSLTSYMFGPAADFFVIDNLSVGAMVQFGRVGATSNEKKDVIDLEPRIGYHIPFVLESSGFGPGPASSISIRKPKSLGRSSIPKRQWASVYSCRY